MRHLIRLFLLGITCFVSNAAFADYTVGRAAKIADGGCEISAPTSGTLSTKACYVYYYRDDTSAQNSGSLPPPAFTTCSSPSGYKCFYLQYANDTLTTSRGCGGDPLGSDPFKVAIPAANATGGGAAIYAMIYGAMMSDRLIVLTVDQDCKVVGARLVETPVRDFK